MTFLVTRDVRATIAVVIVAGACGIAAGTSLAILGAIGRAARLGVIIKGGLYLEALGSVDTIVLDKTGTLTLGTPTVSSVRACPNVPAASVVQAAAIAERPSEHPVAQAILRKAAEMSLSLREPTRFTYIPGKGITCALDGQQIIVGSRALLAEQHIDLSTFTSDANHTSEVLVGHNGRLLGSLSIADTLRPEAAQAVAALRQMGLRTVLLTGDVAASAQAVGTQLGVDAVQAQLLPAEKVAQIKALVAAGKRVAMVGDGVNDAPALSYAHVGVAMGSGTDVARESADVVLLGNDLLTLVETMHIARRCRRIIWSNFLGTVLVDGVGVGLAACGMLTPLLAAFIHVASELAFIANSARLLPAVSKR